jgi:hypothetical protein
MYEKIIVWFDCKPFRARMTVASCSRTHSKALFASRKAADDVGLESARQCASCQGCSGGGVQVRITAAPPKPKVLAPSIDGGVGYV